MKAKESTVRYERYKPQLSKVSNPGHRYRGRKPIKVTAYLDKDGAVTKALFYPVTCAAHHLIPAQASLRECKNLLKYMVSKNDSGDKLKGEGKFKGIVWSDIGYNVNGSENGVFLPGSYGVGGNGSGDWVGTESALDLDDEFASVEWSPPSSNNPLRKMTETNHKIDEKSKKWQYVKEATRLFGGQFHDSHPRYSKFVLGILNKIATKLNSARRTSINDLACDKCKERQQKINDLGVPPPFGLSLRLNGLSVRMKQLLTGGNASGHKQVYTSRWGLAWAILNKK
jgi:hypothetical protein